jgi:hypothetical protein
MRIIYRKKDLKTSSIYGSVPTFPIPCSFKNGKVPTGVVPAGTLEIRFLGIKQ